MVADLISQTLGQPGLPLILFGALLAGVVRGFAGFGTAMIFLPFAAVTLDPALALATLIVMDLIGPVPGLRKAWRVAHRRDLGRLVIGAAVVVPFGVFVLSSMPKEVFRTTVSLVALVMLTLMILGVRYRGVLRPWLIYLTGGISGFLGGVAGIPGPPVIMLYMASPNPPAVIRANNTLFLYAFDLMIICIFVGLGWLGWSGVMLGLLVAIPYLLGNVVGGWLFRPDHERSYRIVAYLLIGGSALNGLPIFD